MTKKRERLEVIRDILSSVSGGKSIKPTRLLYASNLSPQMFKDYVDELIGKGFIKVNKDEQEHKTISITNKGIEFLQQYRAIEKFVVNFGL